MSPALTSAREHLANLQTELAAASAYGLTDHPGYSADLIDELVQAHAAYTAAAVTEIASFRAELSGALLG